MTDDDQLQARLQASDPAASLPPADPARVARLLEDVMATELTTENRETGTRNRGPLTWLLAAAAVLVIAGVGFAGFRAISDDPAVSPPAATPTVTRLEVPPSAGAAKCMVPNAEVLATADTAFDGTVTSIVGDDVTLTPSHWYAGDETDTVVVTAPSEQMQQLVSGVRFQAGERYLVSASNGQVSLCGFSAAYGDDLAKVYAEAFES
ncbi:hypothetical protein [Nocardioides sp. URHA0020]|uniref:hypothetical protein n=1 Tax=Nocardioides sp. URHA0020 TaxID=1380392 RepID=UPI00048FC4EB|nr:hypothetical protein [Nocardioides sp. URHA0020]